jgi:hypothetical protein
MTDETLAPSTSSTAKGRADSAPARVCQRPGCEEVFEPRAHTQRYCSLRCKRWVSNHSPRHLAAKARHDARRRESGLKAMQDARWYANGGWEKQARAQLRRSLAEKLDRLARMNEEQEAHSDGERDAFGFVWR